MTDDDDDDLESITYYTRDTMVQRQTFNADETSVR